MLRFPGGTITCPGRIEQYVAIGGISIPLEAALLIAATKAAVSSVPLQVLPPTVPLQTAPLERTSNHFAPLRCTSEIVVAAATLPATPMPFVPFEVTPGKRLDTAPAAVAAPVPPAVTGTVLIPLTVVPAAE